MVKRCVEGIVVVETIKFTKEVRIHPFGFVILAQTCVPLGALKFNSFTIKSVLFCAPNRVL